MGPFKIVSQSIVLKTENRTPIRTGQQIPSAAVSSDIQTGAGSLEAIINSEGLKDIDNDFRKEHSVKPNQMWLSAAGSTKGVIEFDLGKVYPLGTILVYNYNDPWKSFYGIKSADISILAGGESWQRIYDDYEFAQAEGSNDYDEPAVMTFDGLKGRKVRFSDIKGFEGSDYVGLAKAVFYEIPGSQALNPVPEDNIDIGGADKVTLFWTSGWKAKEHKVYLGVSPDNLTNVTTLKDSCEIHLADLTPFSRYYWRVDEVGADGAVVSGHVRQFGTGALCARWSLDAIDGNSVADNSSFGRNGTIPDINGLKLVDGKIGKAIDFRGTNKDYIEIQGYKGVVGSANRTVAAWIKTTCNNGEILSWGSQDAFGRWIFRLNLINANTGTIRLEVMGGAGGGSTKINDGQWHHAAAVFEANETPDTNDIRLYVDGNLEKRSILQNCAVNTAAGDNVRIGCCANRPFAGLIDDVQIFSAALSDEQIKELYEGVAPQSQYAASMPRIVTPQELAKAEEPQPAKSKNLTAVLVIVVIAAAAVILTRKRKPNVIKGSEQ